MLEERKTQSKEMNTERLYIAQENFTEILIDL